MGLLYDLVMSLRTAKTAEEKEKEKAFRRLEQVGMDRMTAAVVAAEMEKKDEDKQ